MKFTGNQRIDESKAEWIVGSDEVGLGAWAGPLVVAATALPRTWSDPNVGDSKKMSKISRERVFRKWALENPVCFRVVEVSVKEIDELGVGRAHRQAHKKALDDVLANVPVRDPLIIVDGFRDDVESIGVDRAIGLPKADSLIPAVSLASIIAKVTRDWLMEKLGEVYPGYGFGKHKGYGTADHSLALTRLGVSPVHRKSYGPVERILKGTDTLDTWLDALEEDR